ncbi:MAG TPA: hypothetical protein VE954_12665 [Oligoflexus sp.]|uniref:hypothetical protein n=1 Tax=Oligoflexus sp. TaxID=1971216 RepID=UPI002D6829EA|nr:hypothetical protein [Oligoflexus sp.]HYX33960.1 hypothetical protein [Oligoflexus sp.]
MRKNSMEFLFSTSLIKLLIFLAVILTSIQSSSWSTVLVQDTSSVKYTERMPGRRTEHILDSHSQNEISIKDSTFSSELLTTIASSIDNLQQSSRYTSERWAVVAAMTQIPPIAIDAKPFLLNYLDQLRPADEEQLVAVIQVATDARDQLLVEQIPALHDLAVHRGRINDALDRFDQHNYNPQTYGILGLAEETQIYLENLDNKQRVQRSLSLLVEKIDGLEIEKKTIRMDDISSINTLTESLADARSNFLTLNSELANLNSKVEAFENLISDSSVKEQLGEEHKFFYQLISEYRTRVEAALSSEIIIDKFDNILAAIKYVDFKGI